MPQHKALSMKEEKLLVKLYETVETETSVTLGKRFGLPPVTVIRIMRRHGIEPSKHGRGSKQYIDNSDRWSQAKNRMSRIRRDTIEKQGNKCAICKRLFDNDLPPHLDHCHNSLRIRGVLCKYCNTGLGFFNDSTIRLNRAVAYLQANKKAGRS